MRKSCGATNMQRNRAAFMWPSRDMAILEPKEIQNENNIHCLPTKVNDRAQVGFEPVYFTVVKCHVV